MQNTHTLRVRYSEIDAMGTYYNARALDWFECGRTELCRSTGVPYTEWEKRGVAVPLIEAHVEYLGKATYDDLLSVTTTGALVGRARLRFEFAISQTDSGRPVCRGHTVHAITNGDGRPVRPPKWLLDLFTVGAVPNETNRDGM
jgi:acyl-CoA thioester hydrolase